MELLYSLRGRMGQNENERNIATFVKSHAVQNTLHKEEYIDAAGTGSESCDARGKDKGA